MKLLNKILLPVAGIATIAPAAMTMTSCAKSHDLDGLNKKALEYAKVFQDATTKYTVEQIKATGKAETTGEQTIEFKDVTPNAIQYTDPTELTPRMCMIDVNDYSFAINFEWSTYFDPIKELSKDLKNTWWVSNDDLHIELKGTIEEEGIKTSFSLNFVISKYGYIKEQTMSSSYTVDGEKTELNTSYSITYTGDPK